MYLQTHYLQTAASLINDYESVQPFASYLKQFFAAQKKYGSRDRKIISQLCYSYFRLGQACSHLPVQEKIILALFFCIRQSHPVLQALKPDWDKLATCTFAEKCAIASVKIIPEQIFLCLPLLSKQIDADSFALTHLVQPNLFLRIRPGFRTQVLQKLESNSINFLMLDDSALSLKNTLNAEKILNLGVEAIVQDYSSQQTGKLISQAIGKYLAEAKAASTKEPLSVWDCCAASGGKSIMLYDLFPFLHITVSDIRESVLHNLAGRFAAAGIKNYRSFLADLAQAGITSNLAKKINKNAGNAQFSIVLADVPCTGSGTWGRTPEQLCFFNESSLGTFTQKQFAIVQNALPYLKSGGWLVYITCSVFAAENEYIIQKLLAANPSFQLLMEQYITGTAYGADSMYIAILQK